MQLNPRTKYFLYLTHIEQTSTWVYCSIKACIPLNSSLISCVGQSQASHPDSPATAHIWLFLSCCSGGLTLSMMTKMAKESRHGCVNIVLPTAWKPKTNTAALKSAERKNNMVWSSANCFWETWQKSYDTREMLTWHISGRVTHPIPERPVRLYQYAWHRCHILMSATPAETYEEGCWMVHVQWQQYFLFQTLPSAIIYFSHSLTLFEGIYIQSTVWQQNSLKNVI